MDYQYINKEEITVNEELGYWSGVRSYYLDSRINLKIGPKSSLRRLKESLSNKRIRIDRVKNMIKNYPK